MTYPAKATIRDLPEHLGEATEASPFDTAYRGIMRGLYEGGFVPGQRLAAPDLMRMFGVGRGTIREVLHRLASTRVVSIVPNRGAQVRRLSRRDVNDVLDVVEVLLGLAARGAAASMRDKASRGALRDHHRLLLPRFAHENFAEFLSARERYYRLLVQLAGNRELQHLFPDAQVHIMRVQLRTYGRAADSVDPEDFAELTDAILSGDPAAAERAGRRHVEYTRERVMRLPDRAFAA